MKKAGKDERVWLVLRNIILLCGLILILFPLWLVLINSFKTLEEAGKNSRSVHFLCNRTEF